MTTSDSMSDVTQRLYFDDPSLLRFDARVVAITRRGDAKAVVLDRSAFYPESGGQMADHGTLAGARVTDVQLEGERVLHFIEGPGPLIDTTVTAEVDMKRRLTHMALHTGQHILSRALLDVGNHDTVSSRLGETQCTIDLDSERLSESAVAEAEDLANAIVDQDLTVEALFPDEQALALLPLRKRPPSASRVRIIRIGDFDMTPCGGTHCTRSSQVGLVKIVAVERHKRRARLVFVSGPRARSVLGDSDRILRELARGLSCAPEQVGAGIDKLQSDLRAARTEAKDMGAVAGDLLVATLERNVTAGPVIFAIDGPAALMRDVARRVCEQSTEAVCLLAAQSPGGTQIVCARGASSAFDCGAFMKRVAAATGGRGGGRADRAEGRLPAGIDWAAVAHGSLVDDGG